jgi:hypothetical protein
MGLRADGRVMMRLLVNIVARVPSLSRSKRKVAADNFRAQIRRSNELHDEYLQDAEFLENYDRFTHWQLEYLLPLFSDLHAQEGYAEAIDFVISDLAGIGISGRDQDLERAAPAITTMLPFRALQTIATAAEMNARILDVNMKICRQLSVGVELPPHLSETEYCIACREASSLDECLGIVRLVGGLGRSLKTLVKIPLIGITLRAMRVPAYAAGFGALQDFLQNGYLTFRQIPDIEHFLGEIEHRALEIFERIYTAPMEQLK